MSMSNTEKAVKDIHRITRRKFSTEEKIHIVLDGLRGEHSVAELCRQEDALAATGLLEARVRHKPRLLSDNGPCYISGELKAWIKSQSMEHTRGAPYHPQAQGKIERYHRSMKNVVKLENYYYPWELEKAITEWVAHYNHERYHESLDNVTPADVYEGRRNEILDQYAIVRMRTVKIKNAPPAIYGIVSDGSGTCLLGKGPKNGPK